MIFSDGGDGGERNEGRMRQREEKKIVLHKSILVMHLLDNVVSDLLLVVL